MRTFYTVLIILAVLGVAAYLLIPDRHFTDFVFPLGDRTVFSIYDDRVDGGATEANIAVSDSALNFDCRLHTGEGPVWCGMLWSFVPDTLDTGSVYRNWILVDSIVFDMDVQGAPDLLMRLWTYDPDVTDVTNKFSFRPLNKEIPIKKFGRQRIVIPVSELYVPDYWYETQKVDRALQMKHLESAVKLELTAGWNVKRGEKFSVKVYSIEGKGISSTKLGITVFFFLAIFTIAVGVRHERIEMDKIRKRRASHEKK